MLCLNIFLRSKAYSHLSFSKISIDEAKKEIEKTDRILRDIYRDAGIGDSRRPRLFRFPYGDSGLCVTKRHGKLIIRGSLAKKLEIRKFLEEMGYKIYGWDIDTEDWRYYRGKPLRKILETLKKVRSGDTILMHEKPITC